MMWPFSLCSRKESVRKRDKLAVLDDVVSAQKLAARRLQDNLRRAHAEKLNAILEDALPKHEVHDK